METKVKKEEVISREILNVHHVFSSEHHQAAEKTSVFFLVSTTNFTPNTSLIIISSQAHFS